MKSFSLSELKKELENLSEAELSDLCIALAKFKKDNKDFLGYLLVDSQNKPGFIADIKAEIDEHFKALQLQQNLYYTKKSLRKLLRIIARYSKFMGDKAASADLLIYFCRKIKDSTIAIEKSLQLQNMYAQQIKKINALIDALHEDLQSDYRYELEELSE